MSFIGEVALTATLPPRTPKRPGNVHDVIAGSRRIILTPGNTEPYFQIDAGDLFEHHVPPRQIVGPFRCKADTKTRGDKRNQREGAVKGVDDILTQPIVLEGLWVQTGAR